jgi:hypothetical protein
MCGIPASVRVAVRRDLILLVLITFLINACGGGGLSPTEPGATPPPSPSPPVNADVIAGTTGNSAVPLMALHRDGTLIAAFAGDGTSGSAGAALIKGNHKIAVFQGDNGLPTKVVVDDVVFLFRNYTNRTVDIAAVTKDGQTQIVRGIETTGAGPKPTAVPRSDAKGYRVDTVLSLDLSGLAILISFSVCAIEAGGAFALGGPAGVAAVWPTIVATCGSAAIAVIVKLQTLGSELTTALERADNAHSFAELLLCVPANFVGCAVALTQQAIALLDLLTKRPLIAETIEALLKSYMIHGQVTDAKTFKPIPRARVSILNPNPVSKVADANGDYDINPFPSEPGTYTIVVEADKYLPLSRTLHVVAMTTQDFQLWAIEGVPYTGQIRGPVTRRDTYNPGYTCLYRAVADVTGFNVAFSEGMARLTAPPSGAAFFTFVEGDSRCGAKYSILNNMLVPSMELVRDGNVYAGTGKVYWGSQSQSSTVHVDEIKITLTRADAGVFGEYSLRGRYTTHFPPGPGTPAINALSEIDASMPFTLTPTSQ